MKKRITHLVCDLDNTLYDWVGYFVPSFYAMVDQLTAMLGCDREALLDDLQRTHVRYHDAEHAFAVLDTDIVAAKFKGWSRGAVAAELDPAFHAYNRMRLETLRTYPGVHETLTALQREGIILIAHSEAKYHAIVDRLSRLDLFKYFTRIYCRERSASSHPAPQSAKARAGPDEVRKIVELQHHQRKPSPDVLLEICSRENASAPQSAFIGDSMFKDMMMAKDAGLYAIWAQYGANVSGELYQQLVRVTHWTDQEVEQEAALRKRAQGLQPDASIDDFTELLRIVGPARHATRAVA